MLGWFSYFWIAHKTGSIIWRLVILSARLLSILRLSTILLKNVLNVSASSSLFVIVLLLLLLLLLLLSSLLLLLLLFNVLNSLWKMFYYHEQFCCLSFQNSLSYFYAKCSGRDFFAYYRDFSFCSFCHLNIRFEVFTFS